VSDSPTGGAVQPMTQMLASFVIETAPSDVPSVCIDPAKDLILDTMGVALAASGRAIGKTITDYATASGSSPVASILGSTAKVSAEMAALANGTLANALDFDEGSHLSTHILPAALAVAEDQSLSGRDVLYAFILGYEAGARLTQVIDAKRREQRGPTHRGWWHVGLVGPIASALAVSRLLKLNSRQAAAAIGIATCSSGGFRRNMGMMAKALHSGNAARAGIQAAMLARSGFTGDEAVIEAPLGFLQAVCPPEDRDPSAINRLGKPYTLEGQLRLKQYPACNPAHPLIAAAARLAKEPSFVADDIEMIEAGLRPFSLLRPEPWDEESAGFSGAFVIAATLLHGDFTLDQLADETVHDPRVQALMKKIRPPRPAATTEAITLHLKGNKKLVAEVQVVKRLANRAAVQDKFRRCAAAVLDVPTVAAVEDQILRLDAQADVRALMANCSRLLTAQILIA
jgi:2-methylcitrate dehydratase PrpD